MLALLFFGGVGECAVKASVVVRKVIGMFRNVKACWNLQDR